MIVTSNIEDILYDDCKSVGINEIYEKGNVPSGEVTTERIVILSSDQIPSTIWKKCFVEVNLVTPDLPNENGALEANKIRLKELERKAQNTFHNRFGAYDGDGYSYDIFQMGTEEDANLKCHFVNVKILFNVLNVEKQ